jgi:hypothetical protein
LKNKLLFFFMEPEIVLARCAGWLQGMFLYAG